MIRTIILLLALTLLSCEGDRNVHSTETLSILSKTMDKTGHYISRNFLRYYGPKNLDEEAQKELTTAFNSFLKYYNSINKEYQDNIAVKKFIAVHLNTIQTYREGKSNSSPIAVATTLFEKEIHLNNLDDDDLKSVMQQLSLTEEQLIHGIYYLFTHRFD